MSAALASPREFFQRQTGWGGTNWTFWMGVVLIAIGVLSFFTAPIGSAQAGVGLLLMFVSQWAKKNPLARVHDDHLEMKVAIAAPRKLVLFADVASLEQPSAHLAKLMTRDGKSVNIPLRAFTEHDATTLVQLLRTKIAAGKASK